MVNINKRLVCIDVADDMPITGFWCDQSMQVVSRHGQCLCYDLLTVEWDVKPLTHSHTGPNVHSTSTCSYGGGQGTDGRLLRLLLKCEIVKNQVYVRADVVWVKP